MRILIYVKIMSSSLGKIDHNTIRLFKNHIKQHPQALLIDHNKPKL